MTKPTAAWATTFARFPPGRTPLIGYAQPDRHYGVSSPLWDVVFRTR